MARQKIRLAERTWQGNRPPGEWYDEFDAHHLDVLWHRRFLYYGDDQQHHLPHVHVRYQGKKAAVGIADGRILAGEFPARQLRMVQVWMDIHREELMADWELAMAGDEPFRIDPLR